MSKNNSKIIYALTVDDLQNVAVEEYGRKLTLNELEKVSKTIGDYFPDWYDKIDQALFNLVDFKKN